MPRISRMVLSMFGIPAASVADAAGPTDNTKLPDQIRKGPALVAGPSNVDELIADLSALL